MTINEIKQICNDLDIRLTKSKGQNFLVNPDVVEKIIEVADLKADDLVLEIGPGFGVLTEQLIKQVKEVRAVELDKKLFLYLVEKFTGAANLKLLEGDILELLKDKELMAGMTKVVANLPYQITSRLLRLLLEIDSSLTEIVVMVQKEVGERIVAKPGKMSVLSVMVQYYAQPKILFKVVKSNFYPIPKVDSVVLKLEIKAKKLRVRKNDEKSFFKVVKVGFSSKRKMLKNNLGNIYGAARSAKVLTALGLDLRIRAQELSVEEWLLLVEKLDK